MLHFISYGDDKYSGAKKRIYLQAIQTNWFHSIRIYGPEMLEKNFVNTFKNILAMPRGGGYWIWKINIIIQELKKMNENDILIYCDAGCHINNNGKVRFNEYIEMLQNSDKHMIAFKLDHIENKWTTQQIFDTLKIHRNSEIANSGQLMATIMIMKKTEHTINLFKQALELLMINPLLITDHYNNNNQIKIFKDNRHDQSILSLLRKMSINNTIILPDETYYQDFNSKRAKSFPFLSTRSRT